MASDSKSLEMIIRALGVSSAPSYGSGTTLLGGIPTTPPQPATRLKDISYDNPFAAAFGIAPSRTTLADLVQRPHSVLPLTTKRKAFFSFHYDDIMRVNVVRNAWTITHPNSAAMRSFYDSSLWESRKLESDESLKRLIRDGVCHTSAICVLVGADTWLRRWVRYEIARAIVDERGLLAVHLNSIRHHRSKTPHTKGLNPLDYLAVGKIQTDIFSVPKYYLFEKQAVANGLAGFKWAWNRYSDFTDPVKKPKWLADPAPGYVTPLSTNANVYDYIYDGGHQSIGSWIDQAALKAGR